MCDVRDLAFGGALAHMDVRARAYMEVFTASRRTPGHARRTSRLMWAKS
jgi:hypothetical protein